MSYKVVAFEERQPSDVGHAGLLAFMQLKTVLRSRKERQKNVGLVVNPDHLEQTV